jgi:hypothetical protein
MNPVKDSGYKINPIKIIIEHTKIIPVITTHQTASRVREKTPAEKVKRA